MYIRDITMDGFKCYNDKVVLRNLDKCFNAITGANGAGKSNIVDAIVFALDLSTSKHMRVESLKELINIHRKECTVVLTFDNQDKSRSPPGYEHLKMISISRTLDSEGKSKYKLNEHNCTRANVEKLCQSMGASRDFVIMQGHITKVLNKKNAEIRNMIEEVAGTRGYNSEKERAIEKLERKEMKLKKAREHLKKRIGPYLKNLQKEKKIYEENKEFEIRREELGRRMEEIKNDLDLNEVNKAIDEVKGMLNEYSEERKVLGEIEGRINGISELEEINVVELKSKVDTEMMKIEEIDRMNLEEKIEELKRELSEGRMSMNNKELGEGRMLMNNSENRCNSNQDSLRSNSDESIKGLEERELLLSKELKGGDKSQKIDELEKLKRRREMLRIRLQDEGAIDENAIDENDFTKAKASDFTKAKTSISIKTSDPVKTNDPMTCNIKPDGIENLKSQIEELRMKIENEENSLRRAKELENKIEEMKTKFNYPFLEGVYGTIDENMKLSDPRYSEAISVIMGAKSKFVICSDDSVAERVFKASDKRVYCIPLNKVVIPSASRKVGIPLASVSAKEVLDVIEYDPRYEKAYQFVFGGVYIFEDNQMAYKFCHEYKALCVTLDGTVYDPKGTLSGGKVNSVNKVYKREDLKGMEEELKRILNGEGNDSNGNSNSNSNDSNGKSHSHNAHNALSNNSPSILSLGQMKKTLEGKMRLLRDMNEKREIEAKIRLLEELCNNSIDIQRELKKVREELIRRKGVERKREEKEAKITKIENRLREKEAELKIQRIQREESVRIVEECGMALKKANFQNELAVNGILFQKYVPG